MVEAWAIAGAVAGGMEVRRLAVLALAVFAPLPALLLVGWAIWSERRPAGNRAALLCEAASAELRAGASLRSALEVSARSIGSVEAARLAGAGAPLGHVAHALGAAVPEARSELELTLLAAQRSGASIADLFEEVASVAIARDEVAREVRSATSPVRATMVVFAAAPLAYLAWRGGVPHDHQVETGLASLVGAALFMAGLAAATWMIRRAA